MCAYTEHMSQSQTMSASSSPPVAELLRARYAAAGRRGGFLDDLAYMAAVSPRTLRRWLRGEATPSGESAARVTTQLMSLPG